ncbi:hypothetical protein NWF32_21215 [Pseudomonas qingdaonensis]|nr:hypothetical protein [Pseudomonas qingdaonensis]
MNPGQTIFPYVIVTTKEEYIPVAEKHAYREVAVGCGAITFLSESDFATIYDELKAIGSGYALILADNLNFFGDGNFARVFGNLR